MDNLWYKNKFNLRNVNKDWSENFSYNHKPTLLKEYFIPTDFWSIPAFIGNDSFIIGGWDHYIRCYDLKNHNLLWKLQLTNPIYSSPIIIDSKNFVIGSEDGVLRKVNFKGEIIWELQVGGSIHATPTLDHSKQIIFMTSYDHHAYAIDVNYGEIIWKKSYNINVYEDIYSSPALTHDNKIIFGTGTEVVCLDEKGKELWLFETNGYSNSTVAIDNSTNTGVTGSESGEIYAFSLDSGDIKWTFRTNGKVDTSAAINANGIVAIGSDDGFIYAFNISTGDLAWKFKTNNKMLFTPLSTLPNGNFIFVTLTEKLYCIGQEKGELIWEKSFSKGVHSAPMISPEGYLVIGSNWGAFYVLTFEECLNEGSSNK